MTLTSLAQKRLFILGSFVVLLLAVLLYWRINLLMNSFKQIDRTNKVELNLEYVLTYLKDAETGQRGFQLVRDSLFLEPYLGARHRIDSTMAVVKTMIEKNPRQQQNFVALQFLIDHRFVLMNKAIQQPDTAHLETRLNLIRSKYAMDRIRTQISNMKALEREILDRHETERNHYARLTPLSLLVLVFAMLTIIIFSYYSLSRQLQQTRRYATDLDHLNHELVLKNKQLENSVEELNSFNYIASHDLKEPLRKILFFTDLMNTKAQQLSAEARQHLQKITAAGERMKSLLDDLLTYAKASMTELKLETVNLNTLIGTVVESQAELLREKGAEVLYNDLPQIQAVPSQMQQLFENLMTNAVKYSRENVPPVITIKSQRIASHELPPLFEPTQEHYYRILFSDNGIGFSQENAEKIFVLFQRLHQRHEFSGTGIGLTICRKIVQNHDGYITAFSEPGKGTTFIIYLPA